MSKKKEEEKIYRTHQIHIKKGHRLFLYFDDLCHNANNLYNTSNFYIRQVYTALKQEKPFENLQKEVMDEITKNIPLMNDNQLLAYQKKVAKEKTKPVEERKEVKCNLFDMPSKEKSFLGYGFLDCLFKTMKQDDYTSLPSQVNQWVIRNLIQNWDAYFESLKKYKKNPEKYTARPDIPGYLPKGGKKEVTLSNQICTFKNGKYLKFPNTKMKLDIGKITESEGKFQQVRVVPQYDSYVVEVIFYLGKKTEIQAKKEKCMSVDLGIDNLASVVFNTGDKPVLFKGKVLKSINQWYNKQRAYFYSILRNGLDKREGPYTSKRLIDMDKKRFYRIKDYFHKVSFNLVKMAKEKRIDTIIIGKNDGWKQETNMGKKNNQKFTSIPHSLLIKMIQYKAEKEGIAVLLQEESYTSKASFLDNDEIPTYKAGSHEKYRFSGNRIKRGLYRTKNGTLLNADLNGAGNILVKGVLNTFVDRIAAVCSPPLVVNVR